MATRSKASLKSLGIKKVAEAAGISEYRLNNGLKILLKENHSAPVVSFMVVYRVGSRNEAVGHTGSTHFLEHMMFKGTRKFNPAAGSGVMETLARIGALRNATTWLDRTNYFECAGSEYLQLCVEIEADRMRNLNLRQEDRDSEMSVVRNEFERGENNPAAALSKEVTAAAFREHPYHHPTIGWRSDVEGVPLAQMREFYNTFYWPNNATVIVVGDFEPESCLRLIEKYFGKIQESPEAIPGVYTIEPPQEGERFVEVRRAGDLSQLLLAYHTPEAAHEDTYPLAVMHAILGDSGKRSSRLYRALVESGLATSCAAYNGEFRDPYLFHISATLAPGKDFAEVKQAIYDEIARLANEPVTDEELARVKKANRKGTTLAMADPQSFANLLCAGESVADWKWLVEYDDKYDAVTAADVKRVASEYFDPSNRTVGHFIPTNEAKPNFAAAFAMPEPQETKRVGKAPRQVVKKDRLELPRPGSRSSAFSERVHKRVLENGLTVLVMPNPGTGSVALYGTTCAGRCLGQFEKSIVPAFTGMMLTRGSQNFSKVQLAQTLEEMGIRIGFDTDRFRVAYGALVTRDDLDGLANVFADVIRRPVFDSQELQLAAKELTAGLVRADNDTGRRAETAFHQAIYPAGHPFYDRSFTDRIAELGTIGSSDLLDFHSRHYNPAGTILAVVGDVEAEQAFAVIEKHFANWKGGHRAEIIVPVPDLLVDARRIEVNLADKANADIIIGHPTMMKRTNPDFFAAQLASAALGQDTISARLGKMVRVKHGLTYGIYCSFDDTSFGSAPWSIELSVNPSNVSKALKLVRSVVDEYLKKGISADELADESGRAVGSFMVSLRSSDGIARALTRFEYLGLGVAALDRVASDYMAVTRADVNAAMRKHFHPDNAVTVIAGTIDKVV